MLEFGIIFLLMGTVLSITFSEHLKKQHRRRVQKIKMKRMKLRVIRGGKK